jgi:hypothetical protein
MLGWARCRMCPRPGPSSQGAAAWRRSRSFKWGVTMGSENRKYPRQEIELTVSIEASDGTRTNCWVADLSQSGARLALGQVATIPDEFFLLLPDAKRLWCRVVWRSGQEIGVHFERRSNAADRQKDRRPRRSVMIKCSSTRRDISTGIRVVDLEELKKLPDVHRFAQCPFCRVVHRWSLDEAVVPEFVARGATS